MIPSLRPGMDTEAVIVSFNSQGAKVRLINGLHAFIQAIHLTEVPLKNPAKKLSVGDKLKCRVGQLQL